MQRILFITSTRIGDAILSTALLQHLLTAEPEARFTVACGAAAAPLFTAMPRLERLHIMHKGRYGKHWRALLWQAIGTRWHRVIDVRASLTAYALWTRYRHVFRPQGRDHKVVQLCRMLNIAPPSSLSLWTTPAQQQHAIRLLPTGRYLALAPTANWRGKQWPAERFADLALRLTHPSGILSGAKVVVFGAANEAPMAEPLCEAIPVLNLMGKIDLPTVAACLARCQLFIGNDSGLMHLSAASGIPTLGLFGPSDERLYAPWGSHTAFIRTPESQIELVSAPAFDHRTTGTLMGSLSVEAVTAAAEALYRRIGAYAA